MIPSEAPVRSCCLHRGLKLVRTRTLTQAAVKILTVGAELWRYGNPPDLNCELFPQCECADQRTGEVARRLCHRLAVRVSMEWTNPEVPVKRTLICSNHIGYLDIPILLSVFPASIVASARVLRSRIARRWVHAHDIIPVERAQPLRRSEAVSAIARRLQLGRPVIVFPEGITTRGDNVAPFLKGAFEAAIASSADILPVVILLDRINDKPITAEGALRDKVCWYHQKVTQRKPPVWRHLLGVASLEGIDIRLLVGEVIHPHGCSSRALADRTFDVMSATLATALRR
jgi:1-acyl-sn-glycerol-3-phosphate acyltransferase